MGSGKQIQIISELSAYLIPMMILQSDCVVPGPIESRPTDNPQWSDHESDHKYHTP